MITNDLGNKTNMKNYFKTETIPMVLAIESLIATITQSKICYVYGARVHHIFLSFPTNQDCLDVIFTRSNQPLHPMPQNNKAHLQITLMWLPQPPSFLVSYHIHLSNGQNIILT